MWRSAHRSTHRLSFRARESCFGQAFFSIFLVAGLGILYGLFVVGIPKLLRHPPESFWQYPLLLLPLTVGGVFAWIGAWGVAGRRGIDLDLADARVTAWSGYFVPMQRNRFDLHAFRQVVLEAPVKRGGAMTAHWEYPVAIVGAPGTRVAMEFCTPEAADKAAREIAGFLDLDVVGEPDLGA
jgi:hypothetical protein